MISWLLLNLKEIGVLVFGIFSLLLLRSNRNLKEQNEILDGRLQITEKIVDIQRKVINVTENTKPSDFDGNIKRMQDDKL